MKINAEKRICFGRRKENETKNDRNIRQPFLPKQVCHNYIRNFIVSPLSMCTNRPPHIRRRTINVLVLAFPFCHYTACITVFFPFAFLYFNSILWCSKKKDFSPSTNTDWLKTWKEHVDVTRIVHVKFSAKSFRFFTLYIMSRSYRLCRFIKKNANIWSFRLSLHFEWWLFIYILYISKDFTKQHKLFDESIYVFTPADRV